MAACWLVLKVTPCGHAQGTYYETTFGQGACSFAQGSVQYRWLPDPCLFKSQTAPTQCVLLLRALH